MRNIFTPDYYIDNYRSLNVQKLLDRGIKVLVCDIDNTLVAHDQPHPDDDVKQFITNIKKSGIRVVLLSNNVKERVFTFAKDLDVVSYPFARKPLKVSYVKMMKECGCNASEIAVLGDQLLTDMLGANRFGLYTILTNPVAHKDLTCTKINRQVENMIFKVLKMRGKLNKGEYDE